MTQADDHRYRLQALAAKIVSGAPQVMVGAVRDEVEIAISTMTVRFPNGIVLSVGNDLKLPASQFIVMRLSGERKARLPFEQGFEDGCGVSEMLDGAAVLDLIRQYAACAPAVCTLS